MSQYSLSHPPPTSTTGPKPQIHPFLPHQCLEGNPLSLRIALYCILPTIPSLTLSPISRAKPTAPQYPAVVYINKPYSGPKKGWVHDLGGGARHHHQSPQNSLVSPDIHLGNDQGGLIPTTFWPTTLFSEMYPQVKVEKPFFSTKHAISSISPPRICQCCLLRTSPTIGNALTLHTKWILHTCPIANNFFVPQKKDKHFFVRKKRLVCRSI